MERIGAINGIEQYLTVAEEMIFKELKKIIVENELEKYVVNFLIGSHDFTCVQFGTKANSDIKYNVCFSWELPYTNSWRISKSKKRKVKLRFCKQYEKEISIWHQEDNNKLRIDKNFLQLGIKLFEVIEKVNSEQEAWDKA